MYKLLNSWCRDPIEAIHAADAAARKSVSLDANDAFAHVALGVTALFTRKFQDSLDYLQTAIRINPNLAPAYGLMGTTYGCMGECEKSLNAFETAKTLSPRDTTAMFWMSGIGIGFIIDRRFDDAIENCRNMMRLDPNYGPAHRQLCSALALAGRIDEATSAMRALRQLMPELTISKVAKTIPVMKEEDNALSLDGLRFLFEVIYKPKHDTLGPWRTLGPQHGKRIRSWQTKLGSELSELPLPQAGVAGGPMLMCRLYKHCQPTN